MAAHRNARSPCDLRGQHPFELLADETSGAVFLIACEMLEHRAVAVGNEDRIRQCLQ
jgi:hypothetical protein